METNLSLLRRARNRLLGEGFRREAKAVEMAADLLVKALQARKVSNLDDWADEIESFLKGEIV